MLSRSDICRVPTPPPSIEPPKKLPESMMTEVMKIREAFLSKSLQPPCSNAIHKPSLPTTSIQSNSTTTPTSASSSISQAIVPFVSSSACHNALQNALQAQGIIVICQYSILPYTTSSSPSITTNTTIPADWIQESEETIKKLLDLARTVEKSEQRTLQALNNFKQSCKPLIRKIFKLAKEQLKGGSRLNAEQMETVLTVVLEKDPSAVGSLCDLLGYIQKSLYVTTTFHVISDASTQGELLLSGYAYALDVLFKAFITQEKSSSIPQEEQNIILERFDSLSYKPKNQSFVDRTELQDFLNSPLASDHKKEISEIAKESSPLLVAKQVTNLIRRAKAAASKKEQGQKEREPSAIQTPKETVPEAQAAARAAKRQRQKERKKDGGKEVSEENTPTNPATLISSSDPQTKEPVVDTTRQMLQAQQ